MCVAVNQALLPPHVKQRLLLCGAHSKINHTLCLMALSPKAMGQVNSILEGATIKIWNLPTPSRGRAYTPRPMS
jgi:hypothetical protein